jgi:ABC-type multidrug transport system fused ATPase/permease subunit
MYSGERQVIALRKAYLDAVLRQDVGFFDTDARTGDIVFGASTDTLLVQDAIGEKVGNFLHYIATFLAGLVVGFISAWRLALLSVALIPPHRLRWRPVRVHAHWAHFQEPGVLCQCRRRCGAGNTDSCYV